jgi:pyrroline-5-carboxylate reductase
MAPNSIWLFGCGNMGGAMLKGWLAQGMDPACVTVIDRSRAQQPNGVRVLPALPQGEAPPALLVLAIKPQQFSDVAAELSGVVGANTLIASVLAGVEIDVLRRALPAPRRIVRIMPNTPTSIGRGVSVLFGHGLDEADEALLTKLFSALGIVDWITREDLFHAVIAVSGSGPAFVFRFVDAIADAGVTLGLAKDQALRLALATVEGSAALAAQSDETLAALAERVRSPNGTTNAGLLALDAGGVFAARIAETLDATARRSVEMAKAAR